MVYLYLSLVGFMMVKYQNPWRSITDYNNNPEEMLINMIKSIMVRKYYDYKVGPFFIILVDLMEYS